MLTHKLDFNDYFYYDETSPSCLRWKVNIRSGKNYNQCHVVTGDVAGSINGEGYWQVKANMLNKQVHRIIAEMVGMCCDGLEVDHINKTPTDNRIVNLRVVTKPVNLHNKSMYSNNTTGVCGVANRTKCIAGAIYESYIATWKDSSGKTCEKWFSCNKFGTDEAFRLACEYRTAMIEQLNAQGAGYTETHGQ